MTEFPRIGLFVTCLVDLFRPTVGFATLKVLEDAGCTVIVPRSQVCCGQPAYNSGDRSLSQQIARQVIDAFDGLNLEYIVVPSGSCAGMIKRHYPDLFDPADAYHTKAMSMASRTHEVTGFLRDVLKVTQLDAVCQNKVTFHDSCSCRREMQVIDQPRDLLATVDGLELVEMADTEACCGFGGTFSVKYSDISDAMVSEKVAAIHETGADMVLAADLGCLMNIAGKLSRQGSAIEVRHIVEVLAGMTQEPPIAGSQRAEP